MQLYLQFKFYNINNYLSINYSLMDLLMFQLSKFYRIPLKGSV